MCNRWATWELSRLRILDRGTLLLAILSWNARIRFMLLPRFSLGRMFLIMTVLAVCALIAKLAVDGKPWAIGASVALGSVVVTFLVHALLFLLIWPFTESRRRRQGVEHPQAAAFPETTPPDGSVGPMGPG